MMKLICTILFVLAIQLSNGQSKDLIFQEKSIGYYNDEGVPVVTKLLTFEEAKAFRQEHEKFIYLPNTQEYESIDVSSVERDIYYDADESAGKLFQQAGKLKNTAIIIGATGSIAGASMFASENPMAGTIIIGISSLVAIVIQVTSNIKIIQAGRKLESQ